MRQKSLRYFRMLDNNKQIAVCLIIDKNKDNALILLEQIKSVFYVDRIFVIYNNNLDLGIRDDYIKIKYNYDFNTFQC